MTKQQLVEQRRNQLHKELADWMVGSGSFSPGDKIEVVMTLVEETPITINLEGSYTLSPRNTERYYRYLYSNLTQADWEKILNASTSGAKKAVLVMLRERANQATPLAELRKIFGFNTYQLNLALRKAGLSFRLVEVFCDKDNRTHGYQLFAVQKIK